MAETQKENKDKLKEIGALWGQEGKSGAKYLSGYVELEEGKKVRVLVFKNNYKEGQQPDFRIVLPSEDEKSSSKKAAPVKSETASDEDLF